MCVWVSITFEYSMLLFLKMFCSSFIPFLLSFSVTFFLSFMTLFSSSYIIWFIVIFILFLVLLYFYLSLSFCPTLIFLVFLYFFNFSSSQLELVWPVLCRPIFSSMYDRSAHVTGLQSNPSSLPVRYVAVFKLIFGHNLESWIWSSLQCCRWSCMKLWNRQIICIFYSWF